MVKSKCDFCFKKTFKSSQNILPECTLRVDGICHAMTWHGAVMGFKCNCNKCPHRGTKKCSKYEQVHKDT